MSPRTTTTRSIRHRALLALTAAVALLAAPITHLDATAEELEPGGTFLDDDGNVHEGAIEAIAAEGVTRGCGGDSYCPSGLVTRGEMAAFLVRALNLPNASQERFTDDDGHIFEANIDALAEAGITQGCNPPENDRFCPDDTVTRGQMAAFLSRAGALTSDTDHFSDDDGHLFESAINAIAEDGVTKGCNPPQNTSFCPDDTTRRDQMASFMSRFLDLAPIFPPEREGSEMSVRESIRAWFPEMEAGAVRVADCESSLNPRAVNHSGGYHGLFQIGEHYHRDAFERVTGQSWSDGIYTAYYNAQYARHLYDQSNSWRAWTCKP